MKNGMRKPTRLIAASMMTAVCVGAGTAMAQPMDQLNAYRAYLNTLTAGWRGPSFGPERVELLALRPEPRRVKQRTERVVFSDMMFVADSEKLSDVGVGRCYLVAQKLRHGTSVKVVIQSHTNHGGSPSYDRKLGLLRAEAVKSQLESFGIMQNRMSTVSSGKTLSPADQKEDWARAVRERAEFEIEAEEGTSSSNRHESIDRTKL